MASRGINKVILIGNLGTDPEVRYMPNGGAVTSLSLATTDTWKDKESGEQQERTEWHRVVFFNRLAEIAGEYLRKGSKVYIEGALRTRKWQDKSGSDRYTTEIVANEMQMLGGNTNSYAPGAGNAAPGQSTSQQSADPGWGSAAGSQHQAAGSTPPSSTASKDFDDDIPF